jgi:hypothetical protein
VSEPKVDRILESGRKILQLHFARRFFGLPRFSPIDLVSITASAPGLLDGVFTWGLLWWTFYCVNTVQCSAVYTQYDTPNPSTQARYWRQSFCFTFKFAYTCSRGNLDNEKTRNRRQTRQQQKQLIRMREIATFINAGLLKYFLAKCCYRSLAPQFGVKT